MGSGVSWPIGPGVFSRRAGRSSWRRPRTARRSGGRGPCGTRGLPRPPAPPGGSPPQHLFSLPLASSRPLPAPAPTFPQVTPRKDPAWAAPLPPESAQLGATWVALGLRFESPGSEQWAGSQGCGPPPWGGGGTPGPASGHRSPPLGSGWRLVARAPSWRLGSEGLCCGALGTIYMTEEKERRRTLPSPTPTPGKRQENQRF